MRERISQAVKDAMKSGDRIRLSTLRLVQAAITDRDIAARVDAQGRTTGRDRIDDAELLSLLQKMVKQRREAADMYSGADREELADKERTEIAIIEEFMPRQMTPAETEIAVSSVAEEIGATSLKDMGRVMAALKERYAGQMDFAKASALVKARLSA